MTSKPWSRSTVIGLTCFAVAVVIFESSLPLPQGYWDKWWPPEPIVVVTLAVLLVYIGQLFQMIRAANAATDAANVSNRTLLLTQRAWIRMENAAIHGGLRFDQTGVSANIAPHMRNVGNLPAVNVTFHAWLDAIVPGRPFPSPEQLGRFYAVRGQAPMGGWTIFPDEVFPNPATDIWSVNVRISSQQVADALPDDPNAVHAIMLAISGCVDYTFSSDPDHHHQTRFAYEIRQRDGVVWFDPVERQIPATDLVLRDMGLGFGRYAD